MNWNWWWSVLIKSIQQQEDFFDALKQYILGASAINTQTYVLTLMMHQKKDSERTIT